jgi:hypothetical protein
MEQLFERYFDVLNGGDPVALDAIVAADCIDHDPIPQQPRGLEGVHFKVLCYRAGSPEARSALESIGPLAGGRALVTWTTTALHLGATGQPGTCRFTAMFTIEAGRIRESRLVRATRVFDVPVAGRQSPSDRYSLISIA